MTTLNSLEIKGIRSFTPDRTECLKFEKPLTLIVGKNGSGKTTLVECLKAVSCGILPPSQGKGRNFIFNSKLKKCSEVKSSIKMTFSSHNNETIAASRSYSISNDKYDPKKLTFKATDSTLDITSPDGNLRTLSLKSTQMDTTVPSYMGMSRALLDNVIFCHQDENNWPLEDVSKIKARFDDLLETAGFTKALQSLSKARKEQETYILSLNSKLEVHKQEIIRIDTLRKKWNVIKDEIDKVKREQDSLHNKSLVLTEEIALVKRDYERASLVYEEYTACERTYLRLKEECNVMYEHLSEIYDESLEEILKFHSDLSQELRASESKNDELSRTIHELCKQLYDYNKKLTDIGSLENRVTRLREDYDLNEKRIEQLRTELCSAFSISEVNFGESIESELELLSTISSMEEQLNKEGQNLEDEFNSLQSSLLNTKAAFHSISSTLKSVESKIREIEALTSKLDELNDSKDDLNKKLDEATNEVAELEKRLKDLQNEKEKMLNKGYRMKNMIQIKGDINKEDIKSGINFLNYILDNDAQSTESYLDLIRDYKIDEHKLVQTVKRIFEELLITEEQIIQDTQNTIKQLFGPKGKTKLVITLIIGKGSSSIRKESELESDSSNLYFEPYNELVKILTNDRIKEYISYFNGLLNEEQVDSDRGDFDPEKYNELLKSISELNQELSNKRSIIDKYNKELEVLSSKIAEINERGHKLVSLNEQKQQILENKDLLNIEIDEKESSSLNVKTSMKRISEELNRVKNERNVKYHKYNSLYKEYLSKNERNASITSELSQLMSNKEGNDLTDLNSNIEQLNVDITFNKDEQTKLLAKMKQIKLSLQLLNDNITYKHKRQLMEQSKLRLEDLKTDLDSKNYGEIKTNLEELNTELSTISHEIATMNGRLAALEKSCGQNESIETKLFARAQSEYIDSYIKYKCHVEAREDLEKYYKFLESALHSYHLEKITHINSSLKRIWREVYAGTHIDYIQIQSKTDKDASPMEVTSHSYQYRFVMVTTNGVEMDMKGHCSAGERILTSLVVRMALIECFSDNCSILALDEPTTNLDKESVQSLENSLCKLVNESNSNFQLIIITHDETFATKMATLCSCDKYFKLEKNATYTHIRTVQF
ncbi:DNA repair protein Rad50 [Theileria orientalis]|uniref:DNA repair protein Rad50 n=1 Tax=Theileria orientalis TaxID=68886 RepID=A0A976MCU9_THEOR|nr:DNA repair protein Rad50 [Theileria orientalis]